MNIEHRAGRAGVGLALAVLLSIGALGACSAGSKGQGTNPINDGSSGGATNSQGGNSQGGFVIAAGGAFSAAGDNSTVLTLGGSGPSTGGMNGAGGTVTLSDGHIGPPSVNDCADPSKFQTAAAGNRLLYPYDGTVFPRGLTSPLFMWDQNVAADQIYIEAKSGK